MIRIITDENGNRWRCEGRNRRVMVEEIAMARVTGSVGSSSFIAPINQPEFVLAKVHRINPDYSDVKPS